MSQVNDWQSKLAAAENDWRLWATVEELLFWCRRLLVLLRCGWDYGVNATRGNGGHHVIRQLPDLDT